MGSLRSSCLDTEVYFKFKLKNNYSGYIISGKKFHQVYLRCNIGTHDDTRQIR